VGFDEWLKWRDVKSEEQEESIEISKIKPGERMCAYCCVKVALPNYFECSYCGEVVCIEHRIPESHHCLEHPLSPHDKKVIMETLSDGVKISYKEFEVIRKNSGTRWT